MKEVQNNEFISRLKAQYQYWFGTYVWLAEKYTLGNSPTCVNDEALPKETLFKMQMIVDMLKSQCPDEWDDILADWNHELFGQYVYETPSENEERKRIVGLKEHIDNMNRIANLKAEEGRKNIAKGKKYIRWAIIVTAVNISILLGHIGLAWI